MIERELVMLQEELRVKAMRLRQALRDLDESRQPKFILERRRKRLGAQLARVTMRLEEIQQQRLPGV